MSFIFPLSLILLIRETATFRESLDSSMIHKLPQFQDPNLACVLEENILPPSSGPCTGIVYFLHPSGVNGTWMRNFLQRHISEPSFRHLKIIFPDAPVIRYTPLDALECRAWIDRQDLTNVGKENEDSVDDSCQQLKQLIGKEVKSGTPLNRIIIGGLHTGGEMALHMAYRCLPDIAGVFALSTYLRQNSSVYQHLEHNKTTKRPPLLQVHWARDQVVSPIYAQDTFNKLKTFGIQGELSLLDTMEYLLSKPQITQVWKWICRTLPNPNKGDKYQLDFHIDSSLGTDESSSSVEAM